MRLRDYYEASRPKIFQVRLEEKLEMFDHTQVAMKKLSAQVVNIEEEKKLKWIFDERSEQKTNSYSAG